MIMVNRLFSLFKRFFVDYGNDAVVKILCVTTSCKQRCENFKK
jgi:hypothetical protein